MPDSQQVDDTLRIIKKYPNRRLYDTAISCYITLEDVRQIVLKSEPLKIIDSKSQKDITRSILMQIINEQEESGEKPMFTNDFLQKVIRSYGNSMQDLLTDYFDNILSTFIEQQQQIKTDVDEMIDSSSSDHQNNPITYFQKVAKRNLEAWKNSWHSLSTSNDRFKE